ncbi:MAG: bacillithiol biosynthesis cysteine-adding enzyme BshC [Terriglobales bacterium]
MKAQCLPCVQIPHTTPLFADFLSDFPKVQQFYPRSPDFSDWLAQETPGRRYDAERRARVSDILERQNRAWETSEKTIANIARLRAGASAAVTGQQVGLFGGPLFSLYKALTAVKLAEEATSAGEDSVPIFWLATTDHDLAEVNQTTLPGPSGTLQALASSSHGVENAPVGTVRFTDEIQTIVQSAAELMGDSPVVEILRESYRPGETLGSAFARLFARLFADWGVILLDPSDPELHAIAAPIYAAAIERAAEIDEALLNRGKALEAAGYHQQVKVTPSSTLLFTLKDGARLPIHRRLNGNSTEFLIHDEKISQAELLRRIAGAHHDFSPNVLLRPVVQDHLLPTLCYTGGAAEVAYFGQAAVVYQELLGHVTPILPRLSATLVEPKLQGLLERYALSLPDLFGGEEALREKIAAKILPPELQKAFDRAGTAVQQSMAQVQEALGKLDKTLVEAGDNARSKMQHQLETLRGRAARAELRQSELASRHAQQLSASLYPNKALQEREIAGVYYLARHGTELLRDLYACLHTDCHDHQVVTLN